MPSPTEHSRADSSWSLVPASSLGFGSWRLGISLAALLALLVSAVLAAEVLPPPKSFRPNPRRISMTTPESSRRKKRRSSMNSSRSSSAKLRTRWLWPVFRKMESDSSIEDYAQRIAQAWGIGRKEQSGGNGVALLVFIEDRKISIQVGYGLEGALPDVTAFDIRSRHMNPHFRKGDYEAGLAEGIDLIMKAIRGEYKGDGRTRRRSKQEERERQWPPHLSFFLVLIFLIATRVGRRRKGYGYSSMGGPFIGGWSGAPEAAGRAARRPAADSADLAAAVADLEAAAPAAAGRSHANEDISGPARS